MTLTKSDIAKKVSMKVGVSNAEAVDMVDTVLNEISDNLTKGEDVKISSFGNFVIHKKKERLGRNPKTGEEALISARKSISFQASLILKDKVNKA